MPIGIDELDDDELQDYGNQEDSTLQQQTVTQTASSNEDTFVRDFLRTKGIENPDEIMFEDDNGNIETRAWKDLTREEQFNIFNTPLVDRVDNFSDDNDFSDEEIELIHLIRTSNLTPSQYIEQLQGDLVIQEPVYKIGELSDDELYVLDLSSRVGELNEDEAAQALALAKQNEEFYKKHVDGIRKEYKEREDFRLQQEEAQAEQERQEALSKWQDQIIDQISSFKTIGNLDLSLGDDDKQDLASFMLSQDENGLNYLYSALQDPETLVKVAWFVRNGEEAINSISDYFIDLIKLVSKSQYKKGFEDAKKGNLSSVYIDNTKKTTNNLGRIYKTIEDLDDED